jgi:predicted transcriptional regulator
LSLRSSVKRQMKTNEAWQQPIHYTFDENGVTTSVGEQQATIPWKQLYKLVSTKRMVLIYGGRIRANVIPRDQMGDSFDALYELAKSRMDKYRFNMKK